MIVCTGLRRPASATPPERLSAYPDAARPQQHSAIESWTQKLFASTMGFSWAKGVHFTVGGRFITSLASFQPEAAVRSWWDWSFWSCLHYEVGFSSFCRAWIACTRFRISPLQKWSTMKKVLDVWREATTWQWREAALWKWFAPQFAGGKRQGFIYPEVALRFWIPCPKNSSFHTDKHLYRYTNIYDWR